MTTVFITFDEPAGDLMVMALRARGVSYAGISAELYHGDVEETPYAVDAWFEDLPWADETATLTTYSPTVSITSVVIDGELTSTTRADHGGVQVDDWLEDAA